MVHLHTQMCQIDGDHLEMLGVNDFHIRPHTLRAHVLSAAQKPEMHPMVDNNAKFEHLQHDEAMDNLDGLKMVVSMVTRQRIMDTYMQA